MRIGELAERTGVSVRLLRYYENRGLLTADRSTTGQRLFTAEAAGQVYQIRQLLAAGLPTRVIAELLGCIVEPGRLEPCAVPVLVDHVRSYDARLAEMLGVRLALQGLIDAATPSLRRPQEAP